MKSRWIGLIVSLSFTAIFFSLAAKSIRDLGDHSAWADDDNKRSLPNNATVTTLIKTADGFSYRQAVDSARADVIKRALAHTNGNRAAAARTLGLHKTHLLNLMKTLSIE